MSLTAVIGWERERGLLGNSSEEEQSATAASQSRRMISRADVPVRARAQMCDTHTLVIIVKVTCVFILLLNTLFHTIMRLKQDCFLLNDS